MKAGGADCNGTDGRHEAVVGWGSNFADAAATAGEKGGAYSGAEEISPGVWVY